MNNSKAKILILEDDETSGNALKEVFVRDGYQVTLCARPDEAMHILQTQKIEFIFCDCMLPQMMGVDFIILARETIKSLTAKVILMSGIYTDNSFIQESVEKTHALAFLKKPFNVEDALKLLKKEEVPKRADTSTRKLLYHMFSNPNVTSRQKRKVIDSVEEISGFDLPFLYSLLVETKSSGFLNIYHANGAVSGITFCKGNIVGVDIEDKTTYLGEMLIQSGFSSPEDIQAALRDKSNRKLGNYLIQENQLSPHAFDSILAEQMNIRISRTITEEKIRINFAASEIEMVSPYIDSDSLLAYLHDWIASKISMNWLKSLYMMWAGYIIVPGPAFTKDNVAFSSALLNTLEGFPEKIVQKMTLQQILSITGYNEKAVFKAVHFLLTRGLIVFERKTSFSSLDEQFQVLKKIYHEVNGLSNFAMVDYMENRTLGFGDAKVVCNEFITLLGEIPQNSSSEAFKFWNQIKSKAEASVNSTSDRKQHAEFKEASAKTEAEAKLKASHLLEEAKQALQLTQYTKAVDLISQVTHLNPEAHQLHIYTAWAKLGIVEASKKVAQLKEIELELVQVPPDERYDALFPFVIGLFKKVNGDIVAAKKSFQKSIALDANLIVARRELSLMEAQNKKQDILRMDLKVLVSDFFKKKA